MGLFPMNVGGGGTKNITASHFTVTNSVRLENCTIGNLYAVRAGATNTFTGATVLVAPEPSDINGVFLLKATATTITSNTDNLTKGALEFSGDVDIITAN